MKKSFMTRVLATGLSFAMAFSMAAATNVTTASAAAKPKMITLAGESAKNVSVKLGDTTKIKVNAETKTNYKVSKVKVSSSKLKAAVNKAGTVVTIRGVKATEEGKPASARVSFTSKKTKKASKYSYITKVSVIDEKNTMTAAATAVKEITLTFTKAVKDTAAAKIVVKKGNVTATYTNAKWAEDAKSVVLPMDSKLTQGTYDVTVSGVEAEDLTASIVAENQKLTEFKLLSTNLVADQLPVSTASIKFKGVDQYGNFIKVNNEVTVTSSLGILYKDAECKEIAPSSQITVNDDPTTAHFKITSGLNILDKTGTVTIVDSKTGVNLTSEITLVAPAQATKVECLGLVKSDNKTAEMTAGDKISDYAIALKFTDQYGADVTSEKYLESNINLTIVGGTTGVTGVETQKVDGKDQINLTSAKVDGKDVYKVALKGNTDTATVASGTIQATAVNTGYGLLDSFSFTVAPGTVIRSFSISVDNDVYVGEDTTLNYYAVDANGNEVTKYSDLNKAFKGDSVAEFVTLKKQADGSAKLVYNMPASAVVDGKSVVPSNTSDYKASTTRVLNFTLYQNTTDMIVYNTTIKVNQAREIWEVNGVDTSKVFATAGGELKFQPVDFKIADQYGNTMTKDQIKAAWDKDNNNSISIAKTGDNNTWTYGAITGADKDIVFTSGDAAEAKFKVTAKTFGDHKDDGYTLTLSKVEAEKATDFAIEWNGGIKTFNVSTGALDLATKNDSNTAYKYFSVVGKVSGKKVTIPIAQYEIIAGGYQGQNKDGSKDRITKTATLKVVVTDSDHKSNIIESEYTYSNEDSKLTKIDSAANKNLDTLGGATISTFVETSGNKDAAFKLVDQYGKSMEKIPGDLTATISIIKGDGYVKFDGTNKATVVQDNSSTDKKTISEIVVTLTCGDLTKTATVKTLATDK